VARIRREQIRKPIGDQPAKICAVCIGAYTGAQQRAQREIRKSAKHIARQNGTQLR
jgi:hypothetical protein